MDPQKLAQKKVQKYFKKFGKIRKKCEYYSLLDDTYDDGDVTEVVNDQDNIKIIFDNFSLTDSKAPDRYVDGKEINMKTDKKAMFPCLDLSFESKVGDKIFIYDTNENFKVIGHMSDPSDALVELHVRKI